MAERAHPDDPGFQYRSWRFRLRRGWIPWFDAPQPNPYRAALEWRYTWVSKHARGKRILDIPCGSGWGTSMIEGATRVVGVDLDSDSIDFASRTFGRHASFYVGSMEKLEFPADSFDLVSCLEGIEHVPVPVADRFLGESHRVLVRGGRLLLSSPHCTRRRHSGNPYHIHEFQPDEIREKIARHFVIEDTIVQDLVDDIVVHYFRGVKK